MKNRIGVATRNGARVRFSCLYRPGATKPQNCMAIKGKPTNRAAKNETFR